MHLRVLSTLCSWEGPLPYNASTSHWENAVSWPQAKLL